MNKKFTKYDKEMMDIFLDPAKFAKHHLGEAPRFYQERILRHPHNRKVLRCGRRIGKCIEKNQRVLNPKTGEYRTVEEMYNDNKKNYPLYTLGARYDIEESSSFFIEKNGYKEVFEVETESGASVILTGNHPVLSIGGWVEVDLLKIGERIAVPKKLEGFGKVKNNEGDVFEKIYTNYHYNKIDNDVFSYNRKTLKTYIGYLFFQIGEVNKEESSFELMSENKKYLQEVKHLLLRLGIQSFIKYTENEFQLIIKDFKSLKKLKRIYKSTGLSYPENFNINLNKDEEETLPHDIWDAVEEELPEELKKGSLNRLKDPTIEELKNYNKKIKSIFLKDVADSDIKWEKVVSVTPKGEEDTYDVFVPDTHNLVVEDILVHNTWTMTAHMLWVAFTCNGGREIAKGATCLVATPYDTQAREIFDQLNNFISNNEALSASIQAIRRSPYEIVFKNKSRIKLYTAGSRNGAEGGNLRGMKAS